MPRRILQKILPAIALMAATLSSGRPCRAWGPSGHMIVAYIAEHRLNPRAAAESRKLLAIPVYPQKFTKKSLDFVSASNWADEVKRLKGFESTGDQHFVDYPFSTDETSLPATLPKPVNIEEALRGYMKILVQSSNTRERATALRFVIHLVGDIHQPLHCATLVTGEMPRGDDGGNKINVHYRDGHNHLRTTTLHAYWDSGLGEFPEISNQFALRPAFTIPAAAETAVNMYPPLNPAWKSGGPFNYHGWAMESYQLAQTYAYQYKYNGYLVDIQDDDEITEAYKNRAAPQVWQRVAWAGYRLATMLNAIWPEVQ